MKRSMGKQQRFILMGVSTAIVISMIGLIFFTIKHPAVIEEKIKSTGYSNYVDVQYKVGLVENPLYESNSLGEVNLYIASYVNNITCNFQYNFNIEKSAEIKGDYEVLGIVEGYTNEEDKTKTIWKKGFILMPKTSFKNQGTQTALEKEITFSLSQFEDFADQISESAEINVPVKLTVVMDINLQATLGQDIVDKSFAPAITIPLNTSYFEITKSGVEDKSEAIEETKQVQLPVNTKLIAIYGIVLGISLLALLYLLIFVKGDAKVDLFIKQLNKIFKTHGSRLVAINNEIGTSFAMYYKVKSIDDLVRMADELGKPIMYKYSADPKEITKFYIHDDKAMYSFNLKDMLAEKDAELKEKEEKILNNSKDIPME